MDVFLFPTRKQTTPAHTGVFSSYLKPRYTKIMSQEEQVVLVDEDNNEIGTALKSKVHTANTPRHRAFSIFLFNSAGELLLQQRAKSKKTWPLVWSNSCCGHVSPGETAEVAAQRRLQEELGIKNIQLHNILPDYRYRAEQDGIVENEICPVFIGFMENTIHSNPDEIEATQWTSWQAFLKEVQTGEASYSPWAIEEAMLLEKSTTFTKLYSQHVTS